MTRLFKHFTDELSLSLKELERKEIVEFLDNYGQYKRVIEFENDVNRQNYTPVSLSLCVKGDLLSTIATVGLGLASSEELTEDELEKYLRDCLQSPENFPLSLSKLFGNLRLDKKGDSHQQVMNLFRTVDRIIRENGLDNVSQKVLNNVIIDCLPRRPRRFVREMR